MNRCLVLNIVGLTPSLLSQEATPNLWRLAQTGDMRPIQAAIPAVTCTAQSTYLTGTPPNQHGIVGNGWYFKDLAHIWFWRQSNHLVHGEMVWETARKQNPQFTCAQLFWWYNMYNTADWSVTPRPMYPADGRKIPDVYSNPEELRQELNNRLGRFPLFRFWGPNADIISSHWIKECALHVHKTRQPTLNLVYLPHLDYNLQKLGPDHPQITHDLQQIDSIAGELITQAQRDDVRVMVVSEYGIMPVDNPISINRVLRQEGLIRVREELGLELLDPGGSSAFAVADHQIAHIHFNDKSQIQRIKSLIEKLHGVDRVLDKNEQKEWDLDHERSGDLLAVADTRSWFTYYYWLDDQKAPDFARTVDIHRKPGYDPVEIFVDPALRFPKAKVFGKLLKKRLGLRTLMDIIPLDPTLVRGSHGRPTQKLEDGPLCISSEPNILKNTASEAIAATSIKSIMLEHIDP